LKKIDAFRALEMADGVDNKPSLNNIQKCERSKEIITHDLLTKSISTMASIDADKQSPSTSIHHTKPHQFAIADNSELPDQFTFQKEEWNELVCHLEKIRHSHEKICRILRGLPVDNFADENM
jgi:hypothetical protein